jgi:hypothetical protein
VARRPPLVEVVAMTWLLSAGVALVAAGAVAAIWVVALRHRETAAGVEMTPPADGAEVTAEPTGTGTAGGSAGPDRTAPAPGAPVGRAGAPGVTPLPDPDPYDQDAEEMAAALLSQDDYLPDEVERIVGRVLDCLANGQILADGGDAAGALRWANRARAILADDLNPAEVIEVLLPYLVQVAEERADDLLAGVERVAGGGR